MGKTSTTRFPNYEITRNHTAIVTGVGLSAALSLAHGESLSSIPWDRCGSDDHAKLCLCRTGLDLCQFGMAAIVSLVSRITTPLWAEHTGTNAIPLLESIDR